MYCVVLKKTWNPYNTFLVCQESETPRILQTQRTTKEGSAQLTVHEDITRCLVGGELLIIVGYLYPFFVLGWVGLHDTN